MFDIHIWKPLDAYITLIWTRCTNSYQQNTHNFNRKIYLLFSNF